MDLDPQPMLTSIPCRDFVDDINSRNTVIFHLEMFQYGNMDNKWLYANVFFNMNNH